MSMDAGSLALLAISATMIIGFGGMIATIHLSANGTNRRVDDLRSEMDRRFSEVNEKIHDLKIDSKEMRGRIDYIADSLNLGKARARKRA